MDGIESIEIPGRDEVSAMTPEAAGAMHSQQMIKGIQPGHPYGNKAHLQHGQFVDYLSQLNERSLGMESDLATPDQASAEVDLRSHHEIAGEQIMERTDEFNADRQAGLVDRGNEASDVLADLGFDLPEVPDDISEHEVKSIESRALANTGKFDSLLDSLRRDGEDFRKFGFNQINDTTLNGLGTFLKSPGIDQETKVAIADFATQLINQTRRDLHSLKQEKGLIL